MRMRSAPTATMPAAMLTRFDAGITTRHYTDATCRVYGGGAGLISRGDAENAEGSATPGSDRLAASVAGIASISAGRTGLSLLVNALAPQATVG